jgi:hypothetical protein
MVYKSKPSQTFPQTLTVGQLRESMKDLSDDALFLLYDSYSTDRKAYPLGKQKLTKSVRVDNFGSYWLKGGRIPALLIDLAD